jgi:DNA-binding transcriptional ArsR family regulator
MTYSINVIPVANAVRNQRLDLSKLAGILKSLEHPTRYILVDVLTKQPQPACVVFDKMSIAIKKKALDVRILSFSALSFHLTVLERSNLVRRKKVRWVRSPKGYPIQSECYLTRLGLYAKKNLLLFTQYAEIIKKLSGNIKSYRGWMFNAFTFLSIAGAYNGQTTKIELAKLKSRFKDVNVFYYLKRIEERNGWMFANKNERRKCIEIDYIPEELGSAIKVLNGLKTETRF